MYVYIYICIHIYVSIYLQALEWHSPQLELTLYFSNIASAEVSALSCKAAVPKYMQVRMCFHMYL